MTTRETPTRKEIKALIAELEHDSYNRMRTAPKHAALMSAVDALIAERDALRKYAQHFMDCEWVDYGCRGSPEERCTCGLSAALAAQEKP